MKHRNIYATWLLATLFITGCKNQTAEQGATPAVDGDSAKAAEITGQSGNAELANVPAPDAKTVLADVYKQEVKQATGDQLGDGRYVSYWSGKQFLLNGKNYFVAFTEATPPSEIEYPTPEDKVTISQATYEFVGNQWQLKNVQAEVGKFGGNNKAPSVDTVQKPTVFPGVKGRLIMATPTVVFAMLGTQLFFYEIFIYSPEDEKWKYVGSVKAGSDNTAGCAHEADSAIKTKCAKSSATLQFSESENSNWPELKVLHEGTELDDNGNIIVLSDKNAVNYRYDEKSSVYQAVR